MKRELAIRHMFFVFTVQHLVQCVFNQMIHGVGHAEDCTLYPAIF